MISSWLIWVLLILTSGICAVAFESGFAFSMMVLMIAVAVVVIVVGRFKADISFETDIAKQCDKSATISGRVICTNKKFIAYKKIKTDLVFENLLTGKRTVKNVEFSLLPKNSAEFDISVNSRCCGLVRISFENSRAYDLFGMTYKKFTVSEQENILVLPTIYDVSLRFDSVSEDSDDLSVYKDAIGYDLSEVYELRDYAVGDSIKQINWKLSEKHDALIVKRGSLPVAHSLRLILLIGGSSYDNCCAAEVFFSISYELCRMGVLHELIWQSDEDEFIQKYEVETVDDLFALISKIMSVGANKDSSDELCDIDESSEKCYTVIITSDVENVDRLKDNCSKLILVGETDIENIKVLDPMMIDEQLLEIEI